MDQEQLKSLAERMGIPYPERVQIAYDSLVSFLSDIETETKKLDVQYLQALEKWAEDFKGDTPQEVLQQMREEGVDDTSQKVENINAASFEKLLAILSLNLGADATDEARERIRKEQR
jgi:hypothetical protein